MSRAIHITKPGTGSIFERAPLQCGRSRDDSTLVTVYQHLATCKRCIAANAIAVEDAEYARTKAKLEREREVRAS